MADFLNIHTVHVSIFSISGACPSGDSPLLASIPDSHLTSSHHSTAHGSDFTAPNSRLNTLVSTGVCGCWSPGPPFIGTWIQAEFTAPSYIHKVAIQSRDVSSQWVTSFNLAYSMDLVHFAPISDVITGDQTTFPGNTELDTVVENSFSPVLALFLRLYPLTYEDRPSMRWEVYGCDAGFQSCPAIRIANSLINSSDVMIGAHVRVTCQDGLQLTGAQAGATQLDLECGSNGVWSTDTAAITCEG